MPQYVIKPLADEDFYIEFSTITDTIISCGDRDSYRRERIDRADRTGTSALFPGGDSFKGRSGKGLWFRTEWYPEIPEQAVSGRIPWDKVRAFCDTFRDGEFHPTPDLVSHLTYYDHNTDTAFPVTWEGAPMAPENVHQEEPDQ